jgi:squalene cyclase
MKKRALQQEFGFTNWGGKRRGAGRKPNGERARVSHAKRPKLAARFPVLLTMRLREGMENLRADDTHELLKQAFAEGSSAAFRVIEYSVQSNHLLVAEASDQRALTRAMIGLATRIARGLNRLWRRAGRIFDDRYHARILTSPRAVRIALIYVLQNARKHGAWRAVATDVYSSAPWFDGWKGPQPKVADSCPRLLERARTWLLSIGWRRHGLIDLLEAPAGAPMHA